LCDGFLPRQASLPQNAGRRVGVLGHCEVSGRCEFWGCWGFLVVRVSDATPGGHAGGPEGVGVTVADVRKSAEEQAGDVGEPSGAARGDLSAGEEFVEGGEGVVDALGILEVRGVLGEYSGEVSGVGRLRGGVTGTEVGFGIEDVGGALTALGGAALAAFVG
jgi:hypothetical protein